MQQLYQRIQYLYFSGIPVLLRMIIVNMQQYPGLVDTLILINSESSTKYNSNTSVNK